MEVLLNGKIILKLPNDFPIENFTKFIDNTLGLTEQDVYLLCNGKRITSSSTEIYDRIHIIPKLLGGKGGFGSMLRAIGAQIEKTTNREACRDLSGRRLRDINEEKRLKTWIAQQAEREKEAADRKKKKLEKLCEEPKFEFKDESYDQERSTLHETVEDAVTQGLQASCSGKRKADLSETIPKKKAKRWFDEDLEVSSASDDDDDDSDKDDHSKKNKSDSCKIQDTTKDQQNDASSNNRCESEKEANVNEAQA